jgi:hypothetical protein
MRLLNSLSRFHQYVNRGRQKPRPGKFWSRPRLEELEDRLVLSTLNISSGNQAFFVGNSALSSETLTMSEKTVPTIFGAIAERTFTDSNDTITVTGPGAGSTTGSGTNTVTWYAFPGVGSISVLMKAYSNVVNLQSMDCGVYITENQGHDLTANLGNSVNGVQSILGAVGVDQGPNESCNVNVDDSADTGNRPNVTFNGGYLDNLAPAPIHVGESFAGSLFLLVKGGKGDNTFTVSQTPLETSTEIGIMTLLTGSGNATVNVQGTSMPLTVINNGGLDIVNIGSAAPNYGGTLANIYGTVAVVGTGSTSLFVDDSGDPNFHYVDLTGSSLTGLSSALIEWTASPGATGGVTSLTILGSAAGSTYNVLNTPNLHYNTELDTGAGPDTVAIDATTGRLDVFSKGGQDYVYVGDGTLAGINGNVSVEGAGSTWLYVEDHSDTTAHTATLTDKQLSGLSNGTISWNASSSPTGGVTYLELDGSAAASTYSVTNTPNLYYGTYLDLGNTGTDVVGIVGTTGNFHVLNGVGGHAEVAVETGTAAGSINGLVDVYGSGDTYLYVEDFNTTSPRTATLTSTSLTGLSSGAIEWTPSPSPTGGVTLLEIYGSAANTTFNVTSIPSLAYGTTIAGGSGTNTLIGPNTTNTWNITGADEGQLNVSSLSPLQFVGIQNLVGGTGVDTFRFTAAASQVANINGGGAPAGQGDWLDYTTYPLAVAVNLATGKATGVTGTVHNIQDVFGGNHGATLIGDAQGNILIGGSGTNTIVGGSGSSLLIGGSGHGTIKGGTKTDILIAGTTTYNATTTVGQNSLMAILAELQSADTFAQKVSDIINGNNSGGGSDLNGSNKLTWGISGATVKPSTGAFTLSGDTAVATTADWFFSASPSTVSDFNDDGVKDEHNNNAIGVF